jgi:uncharacterized protein DUF2855
MSDAVDFIVNRTDLRQTAFVPGRDSASSELAAGQALLRVDRFAFTANNVTYGAVGDMIGYWNFFPARDGWGRIPVWGFGDVVRTRHAALQAGERVYGYFPMSTHIILQADQVTAAGFIDAAAHRASLPPIYNQYTRLAADSGYNRADDAHLALFRPLFTTAFLLDDFLADNGFFEARSVVLSSASSKTALGLAFMCRARRGQCEVVGLTSQAHASFVERTGYYDRVVLYDGVQALSSEPAAVFVDFAGNGAVAGAVHRVLDKRLKYSCAVGVTHWENMAPTAELPGPPRVFFFAPDQARKRAGEWGAATFQARVAAAMRTFITSTAGWLRIVEGHGERAVESVYRAMLDGKADPTEGHILSL